MTTMLWLGLTLGVVLSPYVRKAFRRFRKDEMAAATRAEVEAFDKGREQGKAETLTVLADTDENAAIIEALGQGVVAQHLYGELTTEEAVRNVATADAVRRTLFWGSVYGYPHTDKRWVWEDKTLSRASLTAAGKTPRDAYGSYMAQRVAAKAICDQLDEVDRVRKEAATARGE